MELADRLLEAHVAYQVRQLRGEDFAVAVAAEVDQALRDSRLLTLDRVMHRDQVKAVAVKYVATFRLPGAIPEIAGEIATRLRAHPANDIALREVISRQRVEDLVVVVAEMRALRAQVLRGLADSYAVHAGVTGLVQGIAAGVVGSGRRLVGRVPLVGTGVSVAEKVGDRVIAGIPSSIPEGIDQRGRELAERTARLLVGYLSDNADEAVDDAELREAVLEVWDAVSARPLKELMSLVSDEDLIDLFVGVYAAWLDVRGSAYITALVETGVDIFFDTYGAFPLDRLLDEFGLGREDLIEEALRFAPSVIEALAEEGLLEGLVRRRLEGFYASTEAHALLG